VSLTYQARSEDR